MRVNLRRWRGPEPQVWGDYGAYEREEFLAEGWAALQVEPKGSLRAPIKMTRNGGGYSCKYRYRMV